MDSNQNCNSNLNNEEENFTFREIKSMSLVTFPKKKPPEIPRNRFFSSALPNNFVPKLHPMQAKRNPSPIKLNNRSHQIDELISLSYEKSDSSSSYIDSSDDNESELEKNIKKCRELRKQMSKFTNTNNRKYTVNDDFDNKYTSPSLLSKEERDMSIHFRSLRHTFDYFKSTDEQTQRGFSIMNILEMESELD